MLNKFVTMARAKGLDLGQLDPYVEDQFLQQANGINNKGIEGQIKFLLKALGPVRLEAVMLAERHLLNKYGMVRQSKAKPEKNIAVPKKGKQRHAKNVKARHR